MKVAQRLVPCPRPASLAMACIDDIAAFRTLRDDWQALHRACPNVTPFTSWEWLFSWWQAYSNAKRLRLLTWRRDGELVGAVPLYLISHKTRIGTQTTLLKLLGDGSADSDYLGFVIRPEVVSSVMQGLGDWLSSSAAWDAFVLPELPQGSALASALLELANLRGYRLRMEHGRCSAIALPGALEEFLLARQPRFRTKLRSLLKKLDEGGLIFETDAAPSRLRRRLRSLFVLHQRRWEAAGSPGVFGDAAKRLFYARFVPRFARAGWLRLYSLRDRDTYLAHQLCFGADGVTYLLQEGFDVSDSSASYGQMLRAAVIRHLIERGESQYDFLGGFSKHKQDWGAREGKTVHFVIARPGWRGWLYFNLPLWRERSARAATRWLPDIAVRMLKQARATLS